MGYTKKELLNELRIKYDIRYYYLVDGLQKPIVAYLTKSFKNTLTNRQLVKEKLEKIYPTISVEIVKIEKKVRKGKSYIFK